MRVVQVVDSLVAGGKERQLCELAKGLMAVPGISTDVVVLSDIVQYNTLEEENVPVHFLPRAARMANPVDFVRLLALFRSLAPDVVHSWNSMCSVYSGPAARLCGAAFVNGFFQSAPTRLSRSMRVRTRLTLPFSGVALANSRAGIVAFDLPQHKSVCIYNGFDERRLIGLPRPEDVRRSLGITTPHVVGMVGGFRADKDYRTYLETANQVTRARDDVTFVAVGDGPYLEEFRRRYPAADYPRIKLIGRRSDVEAVVSTFTVGVLATFTEGISNAVMEYMALCKPVVVTHCPGNRELIEDGATGFLVAQGDAVGMTTRILRLLDDPALSAQMGAKGRKRIADDFGLSAMTEAHVNLYRSLVKKRPFTASVVGRPRNHAV
jgi:glycosyltransferase involved in cell wall biosynthesis